MPLSAPLALSARTIGRLAFAAFLGFLARPAAGQNTPDTPPVAPAAANEEAPPPRRDRSERGEARRANFNPAEMQARLLTGLRTQMEVADDAEWQIISERVTRILDLRRAEAALNLAGLGRLGGAMANRLGIQSSAEMDALRSAVTDKATDAELKSRLEKLREVRKQNETNLNQAREELRAVLTVRQEAIAVLAGLLT
ncbi:MAG: hypothetical protein KF715_21670 [Candidatus Didemnitutus sp.]|nr:hypothetical protein [Candidatus Didemnitutus sp.]